MKATCRRSSPACSPSTRPTLAEASGCPRGQVEQFRVTLVKPVDDGPYVTISGASQRLEGDFRSACPRGPLGRCRLDLRPVGASGLRRVPPLLESLDQALSFGLGDL